MRSFAFVLGLALSTAGCLGGNAQEDTPSSGDEPVAPSAEPSAGETNATAAPESETREGSVTSINVVVGATNPAGDTIQTVPLEEGTTTLGLNVTADGGELDVFVAAPGCEVNSGCEDVFTTEGGTALYTVEGPDPGEWTLRFFNAEPGLAEIGYVVEIATWGGPA